MADAWAGLVHVSHNSKRGITYEEEERRKERGKKGRDGLRPLGSSIHSVIFFFLGTTRVRPRPRNHRDGRLRRVQNRLDRSGINFVLDSLFLFFFFHPKLADARERIVAKLIPISASLRTPNEFNNLVLQIRRFFRFLLSLIYKGFYKGCLDQVLWPIKSI